MRAPAFAVLVLAALLLPLALALDMRAPDAAPLLPRVNVDAFTARGCAVRSCMPR